MRIAMLINYLEREKSIFECIKYQILNISPESSVLIVDFRSPNFMIQLLAFQPETLLMFPLTAKTISYIPYILKAAFKTKIISYRTEGIFPATSYDQLESFAGQGCYGPCCIDAELFWGKENVIKIANLLYKQKKISSPSTRVGIVGYVPFGDDFLQFIPPLPEKILTKIRSFPRKNIQLYLTGFHLADYTTDEIIRAQDIIPKDCKDISAFLKNMQTCLDGVKRFRNHWIKSILTIANKNPDLLLIIKPHPLEIARTRIHGSEAYENFFCNTANILYLQENYHIIPLLQEVGALIHYGSTCAAFAYRYHIYNIYVEYPELFEIAKTEKGLISFNDIRLGGDTRLHLRNLPEFVKKNKNKFTITSNQHTLDTLKSFFGYSDLQKILPSKTIAHILLSKNDFPYQEINNSIDKYFFQLEALPHIAHSINILKELLNIYKTQKQEDYIMRTKEALQRIATLVNSL